MDNRYGTYGKLPDSSISYRIGNGLGDSDMITVGKIDSHRCGPYNEKPTVEVVKDFHWRLDAPSPMLDKVEFSKVSILKEQIASEALFLPEIKSKWEITHPGRAPVVEIANEPNLYPYMSPELYAWYYMEWHTLVRNVMPDALIMNGGFFILEGLPKAVLNNLNLVKIKVKSTNEYYSRFYKALIEKGGHRFIPDIINLHFYPYVSKEQKDTMDMGEHFRNLEHLMSHARVWVTEFGNINPFNIKDTFWLLDEILKNFESSRLEKWHYFQVRGTDTKWQMLVEKKKTLKKFQFIWRIAIFPFRLPGIRHIVDLCSGFFGLPKIKEVDELLNIGLTYIDNLPIQGLLNEEGGLNELGNLYEAHAQRVAYKRRDVEFPGGEA